MTTTTTTKPRPRSTVCGNRIWATGLKREQLSAVLALDSWYQKCKDHSSLDDHSQTLELSQKNYDWFFCQFLSFLSFARRFNIDPDIEVNEITEGDAEDSFCVSYHKTITGQYFSLYVKKSA